MFFVVVGSKHSSMRSTELESGGGGLTGLGAAGQDKYDNYLTKLQNICTENVAEESGSKPVYDSVKSSIQQGMSVLPTPS